MDSIMRIILVYLTMPKICSKKRCVKLVIKKVDTLRFGRLKAIKIQFLKNSNFTPAGTYKKISKPI